jgi:predicted GNAT superfamily acetyltransferase
MTEVDVQIRRAQGLDDYQAILQLQEQVWGFTELGDVAGIPMLVIADRCGGSVCVAEDPKGRIVGFSLAYLGRSAADKLFWWSHMTAVIQEYRNKNMGLRLKLRQREEALAAGIEEIQWTFDPLQALNAHFNIHKLGVIVREYEENIYGYSSSALHKGLPTDRFVAEWRLSSDRVTERVSTAEPTVILRDLDRLPRINEESGDPNLRLEESPLLLEIPLNIAQLKQADTERARAWQDNVRAASLYYFKARYAVTDFIIVDKPRPQALYVLENVL